MEQWQIELTLVALLTIGAAFGGVWYGYELARRRDDRYKATELAMKVLDDNITDKRIDYIEKLSDPTTDLKHLVSSPDESCENYRKQILSVMNQYDLICYL